VRASPHEVSIGDPPLAASNVLLIKPLESTRYMGR